MIGVAVYFPCLVASSLVLLLAENAHGITDISYPVTEGSCSLLINHTTTDTHIQSSPVQTTVTLFHYFKLQFQGGGVPLVIIIGSPPPFPVIVPIPLLLLPSRRSPARLRRAGPSPLLSGGGSVTQSLPDLCPHPLVKLVITFILIWLVMCASCENHVTSISCITILPH